MAECFLRAQGLEVPEFVLGKQPEPISPELDVWRKNVARLREIFAIEWMVIQNYELSYEEKMAFMKDYVDNERWSGSGAAEYFKSVSPRYLENKPHEKEIIDTINRSMDEFMG